MKRFFILLLACLALGACTHPPSTSKIKNAVKEEQPDFAVTIVKKGDLQGGVLPVKVKLSDNPDFLDHTKTYEIYADGFGNWKAEEQDGEMSF